MAEREEASAADRSADEAEEFLPGFTTLEDYSKVILDLYFDQIRGHRSCHLADWTSGLLSDKLCRNHVYSCCRLYWVT